MAKTLEQLEADYLILEFQFKELQKEFKKLNEKLEALDSVKPKPKVWSNNGKEIKELTGDKK